VEGTGGARAADGRRAVYSEYATFGCIISGSIKVRGSWTTSVCRGGCVICCGDINLRVYKPVLQICGLNPHLIPLGPPLPRSRVCFTLSPQVSRIPGTILFLPTAEGHNFHTEAINVSHVINHLSFGSELESVPFRCLVLGEGSGCHDLDPLSP